MGQKVNPIGFRVGVTRGWDACWYADNDYGRFLAEDIRIRKHVKTRLASAGVSRILIERAANKVKVFVHAAKPGIILGKRATGLDALRSELGALIQASGGGRRRRQALGSPFAYSGYVLGTPLNVPNLCGLLCGKL